jgi:hypothetical protein
MKIMRAIGHIPVAMKYITPLMMVSVCAFPKEITVIMGSTLAGM